MPYHYTFRTTTLAISDVTYIWISKQEYKTLVGWRTK